MASSSSLSSSDISSSSSTSVSSSPSVSIGAAGAVISALPASHSLSLRSSTVFLTGGSGFVGRWLLRSLLAPALAVSTIRCAARSASAEKVIRAVYNDAANALRQDNVKVAELQIESVDLAPESEAHLQSALEGVRHVFHLAASTDDWDPQNASQKINVDGTNALLRAAKAAGVRRFVHCSTEAVLAGISSTPIVNPDETHAPNPASTTYPYSRTKALAEHAVMEANGAKSSDPSELSSSFSTICIRPRIVWGHGDTNVLSRIVEIVRSGGWVWIGGTDTLLMSSCHVINLCEALLCASQAGHPGHAYFVTDSVTRTFKDIQSAMFAAVGVQAPEKFLPYWLAYTAATVSEWWCSWFGGRPLITRQALAIIAFDVTVKDDKARKELGYVGKISVEDGLKKLKEHFDKFHTIRDF